MRASQRISAVQAGRAAPIAATWGMMWLSCGSNVGPRYPKSIPAVCAISLRLNPNRGMVSVASLVRAVARYLAWVVAWRGLEPERNSHGVTKRV